MKTIYVIDTSSIINFFKYYQFDKANDGTIYTKLRDFIIKKIKTGEIAILDKVNEEIKDWRQYDFKNEIKEHIISTTDLIVKVRGLSNKYYRPENEERFALGDQNIINQEIQDHENKHADLFLIAKCINITEQNTYPILVTDETKRNDDKLYHKIPTMCNQEKIKYINLPKLLFEEYKTELIFGLKIQTN